MQHNAKDAEQDLKSLANEVAGIHQLFTQDEQRSQNYSIDFEEIFFDYSKQRITLPVKNALVRLAKSKNLAKSIHAMVSGQTVNVTENRAALHTALRLPQHAKLSVAGDDVVSQVHDSLEKLDVVVKRLTQGLWRGYSGHMIRDVVNIGVGGSDLGPLMTCTALADWSVSEQIPSEHNQIHTHFVSNMDGTQLDELLKQLNPHTTVFVISSKSFSTSDTFSNARTALAWLSASCKDEALLKKNHFIGISANPSKMDAWDIDKANQLKLWDWVGGRFSMWSAIGLTIALKIGMANFYELLAGAHTMDQHFIHTDFEHNIPVMMGLLGVWNSSFLNIHAHTVLPYDGRLKYFPNYLTQLEMESNGKSVDLSGKKVTHNTCPILWGDIGSNAQHAFYQLLHQGTQKVSCDFIAFVNRYTDNNQDIDSALLTQHQLSLANCLAQSRVLAFGNAAIDGDKRESYQNYHGNQPSSTLLIKELNPKTLGMLIALYEHKVYVMAVMWGINPFDQWGVELGKVMAGQINEAIKNHHFAYDSSTNGLLQKICSGA